MTWKFWKYLKRPKDLPEEVQMALALTSELRFIPLPYRALIKFVLSRSELVANDQEVHPYPPETLDADAAQVIAGKLLELQSLNETLRVESAKHRQRTEEQTALARTYLSDTRICQGLIRTIFQGLTVFVSSQRVPDLSQDAKQILTELDAYLDDLRQVSEKGAKL